jgi:hypothetical protein
MDFAWHQDLYGVLYIKIGGSKAIRESAFEAGCVVDYEGDSNPNMPDLLPERSYKRECQEKNPPRRLDAGPFFSAFSPTV